MSLVYDKTLRWQALIPVLSEHSLWFHDVIRFIFYPEHAQMEGHFPQRPTSYARWLVTANEQKEIQHEVIEKLSKLHADLIESSDLLIQSSCSKPKPEHKIFQDFLTHYEEFQICVRRLENDLMQDDSGFDPLTGLRSKRLMQQDIEKELHRLARQGRSFCIVAAQMDDFQNMCDVLPEQEISGYVRLIADLIKISIRSYDDAYYLGDGEYILCIKQTDARGAISALERLKAELEKQNIEFDIASDTKKLSMSCCISEPLEYDLVDQLLDNLRKELSSSDRRSDRIFEYYEVSPLQKYAQGTTST